MTNEPTNFLLLLTNKAHRILLIRTLCSEVRFIFGFLLFQID